MVELFLVSYSSCIEALQIAHIQNLQIISWRKKEKTKANMSAEVRGERPADKGEEAKEQGNGAQKRGKKTEESVNTKDHNGYMWEHRDWEDERNLCEGTNSEAQKG